MEEEIKEPNEINPEALEEVAFEVEIIEIEDEESEILLRDNDKTELDAEELDLAFHANDEGYW